MLYFYSIKYHAFYTKIKQNFTQLKTYLLGSWLLFNEFLAVAGLLLRISVVTAVRSLELVPVSLVVDSFD